MEVYYTCARGGGKSYEQFRKTLEMMVEGKIPVCRELEPIVSIFKLNMRDKNCEEELWPKENPYIRKEKKMDRVMTRMTEVKKFKYYRENQEIPACRVTDDTVVVHETEDLPVINGTVRAAEIIPYITGPFVDRLYAYEQLGMEPEEIKRGMQHDHDLIAKLRKENAELRAELARTNCDLLDAEERNNVKDAHIDDLRVEIDGLRNTVNAKVASIRKLVAENLALKSTEHIKDDFMRACTVRHIDTFELDKKKLFEENNKLHAEIDELRDKNRELETDLVVARDHANELRSRNAFLTGVYEGGRALKKAHAALNEEYKRECAENQKLLDKNGSLAMRIGELERKLKASEDCISMKTQVNDEMRSELATACEKNRELTAANENLNDLIKKMDKKLGEPVDDNRDMVIENQAKYIRELEYKLRKYKIAGIFIKSSIAVAEDPEVPKYEKHS